MIQEEQKVVLRFLEPNEFYKLEGVYKEHDDALPSPELSSILVAELEDETIIGFCAVQLNPFITMWIQDEYRHNGIWKELVEGVQQLPIVMKAKTYIVASRIETVAMCQMLGLRLIDKPVFVKD